ncbi:MAG TPA: hypothetical protein VM261_26840 [Kofleriaceae bacterium]|nr:hypothetical protein [Kofleriaceae bacterium]
MPQVIEFPSLGGVEARQQLLGFLKIARETPPGGESFTSFRSRLRAVKLWDRDRPAVPLRVLGASGATVTPTPFMQKLAASASDDDALDAIADRLLELNPLLFKTVMELIEQRPHGKDEISKYLGSFAYRGKPPSRPDLESFFLTLLASGVARTIGIALVPGPRAERLKATLAGLDVDELLENPTPFPEPVIPGGEEESTQVPAVIGEEPSFVTLATVESTGPGPEAPAASPLPRYLRHLASARSEKSPLGRERAVPVSRFAGGNFSDELLEETTARMSAWWKETPGASPLYTPADFGFDPEAWVEGADEVIYRIAVAAALVFRLESDRDGVIRAFKALDKANVLADLYHGTVPENLPSQVDARALMLASLAARRCAETPELASSLEQQKSAADAFSTLDAALGRGLFRIELHWILGTLGQLGVIRFDDLGELASLPHRLVRDQLFRMGFLPTPYAADGGALVAAARAARKAAGGDPADEIISRFALAAGCAYDCPNRRVCDYPCRERLE